MKLPEVFEHMIVTPSGDMVDEILNGRPFGRAGNVFFDLNGRKFIHDQYYLGGNAFGFYLVAAESDDLCRVAYERGDLSAIDFWSRFGFVWKLAPVVSGLLHPEKIGIQEVDTTTRFAWDNLAIAPIKLAEKRFKDVLTSSDADPVHVANIRQFRVRYLEALAIRKRQWQEIDSLQKSA